MIIAKITNCGNLFTKFQQSLSAFQKICNPGKLTGGTQYLHFSYFCNPFRSLETNKLTRIPFGALEHSFRGFKTRGHLQLRCKDCYMVRKDGIVQVLCNSYPRHKQIRLTKRTKYSWILTYAFQTKQRPY